MSDFAAARSCSSRPTHAPSSSLLLPVPLQKVWCMPQTVSFGAPGQHTMFLTSFSAEQVAGHDWKIVEEGKSAEGPQGPEEPKFSTWEDIANMRSKGAAGSSSTGSTGSTGSASASGQGDRSRDSLPPNGAASAGQSVADDQLYRCCPDLSSLEKMPAASGLYSGTNAVLLGMSNIEHQLLSWPRMCGISSR